MNHLFISICLFLDNEAFNITLYFGSPSGNYNMNNLSPTKSVIGSNSLGLSGSLAPYLGSPKFGGNTPSAIFTFLTC